MIYRKNFPSKVQNVTMKTLVVRGQIPADFELLIRSTLWHLVGFVQPILTAAPVAAFEIDSNDNFVLGWRNDRGHHEA